MVKFAHNDTGLLACCSLDGSLSICQVAEGDPRVLHTLHLHTAGVTGKPHILPQSTTSTPITLLSTTGAVVKIDVIRYIIVCFFILSGVCIPGFDWSATNDLLLSCGEDGKVCLWSVSSGECLRAVSDQAGTQVLSCVFHPFNSNWAVVSFAYQFKLG